LLGQAGGVLATVATSAFNTFVMGNFVLIITYFTLAEAKGSVNFLKDIELVGHKYDLGRMRKELSRIWNTYLSSQVFIFLISFIAYLLLYSILGVRNTLALALLAGLAKFVPYVGPIFTGIISALVAFFQAGGNPFGMEQLTYMIIVVAAAVLLDQLFDGFVTPRIYGANLGIHPAAVLIAAIVAARMIGFMGLIMAAPILATFQLFARYVILKMLDQDPWPEPEPELAKRGFQLRKTIKRFLGKVKQILSKIRIPWNKGKRK
jgi:predicted PurR-regulated permease PerM